MKVQIERSKNYVAALRVATGENVPDTITVDIAPAAFGEEKPGGMGSRSMNKPKGGRRPGSGRPRVDSVGVNFRLRRETLEWIDAQEGRRSEVVERLVKQHDGRADMKTKIAKQIEKLMRVSDCTASGSYPQCYVWVVAEFNADMNVTRVLRHQGPHGDAYDPAANNELWARFSLDCDDHVRYRSGPLAGTEARGREAVVILADDCALEIMNGLTRELYDF